MPRVLPSQVVALIDRMFPFAATQIDQQGARVSLGLAHSHALAAILDVTDQIPRELIIVDGDQYVAFTSSTTAIRTAISIWQSRGDILNLVHVPGLGELHPVTHIRRTLASCPDN